MTNKSELGKKFARTLQKKEPHVYRKIDKKTEKAPSSGARRSNNEEEQ